MVISMKVGIKCDDKYLYQKIKLILTEAGIELSNTYADVFITDCEVPVGFSGRVINMARSETAELTIPFSEEELIAVLGEGERDDTLLSLGDRCALLRSERISLTELEYSLLDALISANGEFISREILLEKVWSGEASNGILNVYIHYLREKLEKGGEKIIVSSRKQGYKISERYIKQC